jgi:hypothetical protein
MIEYKSDDSWKKDDVTRDDQNRQVQRQPRCACVRDIVLVSTDISKLIFQLSKE